MKNIASLLFSLLFLNLSSCGGLSLSDVQTAIILAIYKDGNRIYGTDAHKKAGSFFFLEHLKIKLIPKKQGLPTIEKLFYKNGKDLYFSNPIMVPLYLNIVDKNKDGVNDFKNSGLNPEEFTLVLTYKDKKVFNEVLKLNYVEGNPFPKVSKIYYKDNNKWQLFKRRYKIKSDDGKETDLEFEIIM